MVQIHLHTWCRRILRALALAIHAISRESVAACCFGALDPLIDSADILNDPVALRARADQHGYIFVRGLLPQEAVMDLRRDMLQILERHGLMRDVEAGLVDSEAIAKIAKPNCGAPTDEIYLEIQKLESFHALPHHPALINLYEKILGGTILPHPRHIARVMLPNAQFAPTPPHQDFVHIQGTENVWTCWFPLGDTTIDMSQLAVLDASHRDGILKVKEAPGAGGLETWLCNIDEPAWHASDMQAGDILTFTSTTVHESLPMTQTSKVRISCDVRYQRADETITERSLSPHCNIAEWPELYAGWSSDKYQYYWRNFDLQFSEMDMSLATPEENIC